MIYFIKNVTTGNIKIGFSESPRSRLQQLQTGSAEKLVLMKTIEGDQSLERQLHEQFSHCCVGGEWFTPADEILEFIKGKDRRALEGKFFHSLKDGEPHWQGYVIWSQRMAISSYSYSNGLLESHPLRNWFRLSQWWAGSSTTRLRK